MRAHTQIVYVCNLLFSMIEMVGGRGRGRGSIIAVHALHRIMTPEAIKTKCASGAAATTACHNQLATTNVHL